MISCDVHNINFDGVSYFAQSTGFPTKCICLSNTTDSHVQFSNSFVHTGCDFSIKVSLKSLDGNHDSSLTTLRIRPQQSLNIELKFVPDNLTQQYLNHFKCFTTINLPYTVEGCDEDYVLPIKISATLCTSVMFINQSDIDFQSCAMFEVVTREFEVWNRSDCDLEFRVETGAMVNASSNLILSDEGQRDMSAELFLEDCDSKIKVFGSHNLFIAPFASKLIKVQFQAKIHGQFSASIILTNINNPSNVLTLFTKAVVQSAIQQKEYLVELFAEEEPESNILLLNADNDSSFSSSLSATSTSSDGPSHNLDVGDCYSGVKKLKRCWLRNTSAFRVEVVVEAAGDPNIGRPSGETQIFYSGDEVSMDPIGHVSDATFAYSQMEAAYNRSHSPDLAGETIVEKSATNAAASLDTNMPENNSQKPPVDAGGRQTPQSILVSDSKRQQQQQGVVATRSRNVSFSSTMDSVDVARSTADVLFPADKEGGGLAVFAADQQVSKPVAQQTRPAAQSTQKDRPVGANSAGFEVVESLHDKATPWGLYRQGKVAKSSTVSTSSSSSSSAPSTTSNSGSNNTAGSGKSSTSTYANDHGVTCGKLWGDAGLCQSLVDDEECWDSADKSLTPAMVLGGAMAMEGGGISSRRFFNGKSSKSLLRAKNQKGGKKNGALSTLVSPGALEAKAPESFSVGEMSVKIQNDSFVERREPQQGDSPKAVSVSTPLSMRTQDNVCAVLVLEPFERRPCTLMVTPSADYFDNSGAGLSGVLVLRSLGLVLRCQTLSTNISPSVGTTDETEDFSASQEIRLSLRIRVCTSVVTVTPQLYDLGLCSVGEFRWVIFTVQNDSDLPALVYSFVQSETLSIPEPELFIPPRKSKQLKIEYVAHQENTQYNKKAVLLNVFNEGNHNQVEIRAKNVDTQQVLLHSLFYKLITYNNKRQLQVYFERGLINMPNLRTFCVKNTHSAVLRVQFTVERGRNLQLFLVKSVEQLMRDQSDVVLEETPPARSIAPYSGARSSKQTRFNDFNLGDFGDETSTTMQKLDKSTDVSTASSFSPSVATTAMNQHIEDLKWGDENDANRLQRVSKSASMRMSGGGLDDEFHLTKSQKMSRLNQAPLSSDLDALDVNVSTVTTNASTGVGGVNSSSTNTKSVTADNITTLGRTSAENSTAHSTISTSAGRSGDVSRLSPKVLKDGTEEGCSVIKGSSQKLLDLVQELDKGDFPHSFLRQYNGNDDETEGDQEVSRDSNSAKTTSLRDSSAKTQQEVERQVKAIQRTYTDLKALLDNRGTINSCLVPLLEATRGEILEGESNATDACCVDAEQSNSRSFVVDIPVGATFNFAVVLFPQQSRIEDQDECHQTVISEAIQIRLPQITSSDIDAAIKSTNQSSEVQLLSPHLAVQSSLTRNDLETEDTAASGNDPLKSRSMLVRAKAVRCEMIVIQKNISFGRTLVGDKTSRVVTLVNRSSIACLFSISKSGSISSGFLQIPQGRHGVIPAYSTKHVEFIFRPTLPGSFEETMLIENVLNPRNSQSIVVKAKVSKAESFVLLPHIEGGPALIKSGSRSALVTSPDELTAATSQILPDESTPSIGIGEHSLVDSDSFYRTLLDDAMVQIQKIGTSAVGGTSSMSPPVFLGSVAVGEQCETVISFRIKNQTSKKRQFIVDSTHPTAVSLLAAAVLAARTFSADVLPYSSMSPPRTRPPLKPTRSKGSLLSIDSVTTGVLHSLPFEPFPEILQSVVSLSCTFSSVVWSSADKGGKSGGGGAAGQDSLSEEQRLALEDSLEKFQQKLKIAVRKNKTDKIDKYQKKINKVIASLTGVKEEATSTGADVDSSVALQLPTTLEPVKIEVGSVAIPPPAPVAVQSLEESDVAHHFSLEPDQEKVVTVKLTFLPAASYSHWDGILPFLGFLRVFECRNEDTVKAVHFGAMVYSSRVAFGAAARRHRESLGDFECLPIDEDMDDESEGRKQRSASQELRAGARRLESKPSFQREVPGVDESEVSVGPSLSKSRDRLSLSSIVELQKVENSFLITVAQWSSFPTKLIYPKYRQLPQNVLGMSVKLVQASKDRVMYGSLSLASVLLEREAVIDLFVEDSFNVKSSSDYVSYNSKIHGAISFGLASSSSSSNDNDTSHLSYHDSVGSDEAVRYSESRIQTQVSAGGKLLFVIKWRPPVEEQRNELNLLGAFKVQCRVKDKVVGAEQFVPFICVREHKSVLRVERYSSFGDITVGSYRMASVAITNTSPTEDLHYLVSSEELTASARAVGKVQINSGQTGVVPPSSSRTMSLLFSATSPGKFEQKLWIRNISDGFDQKRIAIQANVTITHAKFVTFPDLEHSLDSHEGKYKPIDLGLIQIQSQRADAAQQHVINDDFYRLRIENVSDKSLCVTAISNLKSQCFVYVDEACTQLAVNHPMPQHACTTLFVLIRPAQLHSKSSDWIASAASKPSSNNLVGLATSKTAVDLTAMSAANLLVASSSSSEAASKNPVSLAGGGAGRELKGGIRLVFFISDSALSEVETSSPPELVQRKLFETALSFKAVVGKSLLKLKSMTPALQCIKARVTDDLSSTSTKSAIYQMARGSFEIRNDSSVFPLRFSYVVDSAADCVGISQEDWVAAGEVAFAAQTFQKVGGERLKLLIADTVAGVLPPGQSRLVDYAVFYSSDAATARSGLGLFDIRMVNLSTKDTCQVKLGVFFDCDQVRSSLDSESSPSETADDIPILNISSPVWLAGLDSRTRGKRLRRKQQRRNKNGVGDPDGDVFESAADSDGENESVGSSADVGANLLWYEITGAAANVLCSCVIRNTHRDRLLTLTPVSDLPLVVHTEPLEDEQENDRSSRMVPRDGENTGPWQAVIKQQNQLASVVVGKWKRNICIRGEAFTLPPGCAVRVTISAPRGMLLDEELVDDLQRGRLESGSQCKVSGIVAFLQSAHSLQSLFDQTQGMAAPLPPVILPDSEKPPIGAASQLQSLFAPPVDINDQVEAASPPRPPPLFPVMFEPPISASAAVDLSRVSKTQQFEVYPVLSIFKINCSFVVPKLQIPCSVFALGKLRGGYQTTVEITVVNLSEVDVPCSIECLPSWLTLHPSNFATGGAFYFSHSTSGFAPGASGDEESCSTRTRKNTWTSLSSGTIDIIDSSTPIRSGHANSLGAKKMQMWFNKNTATEVSTSPEVLAASSDMVGQLSDLSSLAVYQRRFTHSHSESLGGDGFFPDLSSASSADCANSRPDAEEDAEGEDMDTRSMTSLDVHHESVFAASLIDAIGTLDAELLPPRYREGTTLFSAKRCSRTIVKFVAKAPFVETQRLEHKIRIKNLTSCSSPYFTSASDFEVLVRLDVDSTRAVEVSGGPNDPLVVSSLRARSATTANTPLLSPKAGGGSSGMFSPERNTVTSSVAGSISTYRLLKEPFLVPPSVMAGVSAVSDTAEGTAGAASPNRGSVGQQISLKSDMSAAVNYKLASEAKTHCILFLKNNLSKPVRVTAILSLNPAVSKVLSMQVKFPQNNEQSDCVLLQPKETAEIKIRVSCRIGSRFSDVDSAQLVTYVMSSTNPDKNQSVDTGKKVDNVELASSFASCGPILFGAVSFHPSVVEQEKVVQTGARERSRSTDLLAAVQSGSMDRSLTISTNDSERLLLARDPSALSIALLSDIIDDALHVAPQDLVSVDIVGFLSAGPTVAVNKLVKQPICGSSNIQRSSSAADSSAQDGTAKTAASSSFSGGDLEDLLVFRVTEDATQTTVASSTGRRFRVVGDEQYFYLNNPSPNSVLNFSIKSGSYRHPGMQLFLPDLAGGGSGGQLEGLEEQGREGYYDTVTVQASPSRGAIPPGASIRIVVNMLPGVSGGSVKTASTMASISDIPDKLIRALARGEKTSVISSTATATSSFAEGSTTDPVAAELPRIMDRAVLACMPLLIGDDDWPQHPARKVFTYLISDSADVASKRLPASLPDITPRTEAPVVAVEVCQVGAASSATATKQSDSMLTPNTASLTDVASSHQIRLRGVTPSASRIVQGDCYSIDLKQQPQRKESIEWLVSVENCGPASGAVPYTVFASDQSWLTVGQSRGAAAAGGSSDIMLYLSRANVGMYSAYVVVRNGLDVCNNQVICVSMEVVSGGTDSGVAQRKVSLSSANQAIVQTSADTENSTFFVSANHVVTAEQSAAVEGPLTKVISDGFRIPSLFCCRIHKVSENKFLSDSCDSLDSSINIIWPADDSVFTLELLSLCDMPLNLAVTHDCPTLVINGSDPLCGDSSCSHGLTLAARQAVSIMCDVQSLKEFRGGDKATQNIAMKVELPMFGESQDLLVSIHRSGGGGCNICT